MKHRNLVRIIFLLIVIFSVTSPCIADTYPAMYPATAAPQFFVQRHSEEGFAAGTLVRTPGGYQPIETITEHSIVLDDHAQPKRVLKVVRRIAQQCVRITIDGQTICMGYEQVVHLPYNTQWCSIDDVQKNEYLLSADGHMLCVEQCELIPEVTVLYQLSVEDHIFCVGSENLIVHNADVATISTAILCLEYVAYVHPVAALIGSTIALSTIARQAYKSWRESRQHEGTNDTTDKVVPQEFFLAERYYYEQRKKALTTLRDEFEGIYRGIIAMKELFHPNAVTFSSQFLQGNLQQHTQSNVLRISIADELKLSDDRRTALRNAREQEFALLEKEISALHALLVVHFNELRRRVNEAHNAYYEALPTINHAINVWNANLTSTTDSIASSSYEQNIREECFLNTIKQATTELKVIIAYYQRNKQLACLQQSTDILEQLDWLHQAIIETEQWISQELSRVAANQRNDEHYFTQCNIPTSGFKNQIKNSFHKDQNNKNTQSLKEAQDKVSSVSSGGPKKNDDDDNDPKKIADLIQDTKKLTDLIEEEARKRGWDGTPTMPSKDDPANLNHVFPGNKFGHDSYSDKAYQELQDLVQNPANFTGKDKHGSQWFRKELDNGKTRWARSYGGTVKSGGTAEKPTLFDPEFGLMQEGSDTHFKYLKWLRKNGKEL